jgi:hypothetical protein
MIIVDMFQEGDKLWVRPGRKVSADGMVLELPSNVVGSGLPTNLFLRKRNWGEVFGVADPSMRALVI